MRMIAILGLALATACSFAATAAPRAPPAAAMDAPIREALTRRCGAAPRCALYTAARPPIALENLQCRDIARGRYCTFSLAPRARPASLACGVELRKHKGRWSDLLEDNGRPLYLPTGGRLAPRQSLTRSTLSCSGSLVEYVNQEARN